MRDWVVVWTAAVHMSLIRPSLSFLQDYNTHRIQSSHSSMSSPPAYSPAYACFHLSQGERERDRDWRTEGEGEGPKEMEREEGNESCEAKDWSHD